MGTENAANALTSRINLIWRSVVNILHFHISVAASIRFDFNVVLKGSNT